MSIKLEMPLIRVGDAMSFYDTVIRNSSAFRSDAVCKDTMLLEPGTRAAVLAVLDAAKKDGHDLRLLETYRSQIRQSALFAKHATQLRTVGCHGYGVAVDFGVFINGKYAEDNKPYVFLRDLARRCGMISGQDWGHPKTGGFVDSGHVQRVPVWRQVALFGGSWYPPEIYDPYEDSKAHGHLDVVGSLTPAPAQPKPPAPTADPASRLGRVTASALNVRAKPDPDAAVVEVLQRGAEVTVVGDATGEWLDIGGRYVAARWVQLA